MHHSFSDDVWVSFTDWEDLSMNNSHGWPIQKKDQLTFSVDLKFSVLADIGPSADGEAELQDVKLPGVWIGDEFFPLSGFKNVTGDSILDILKGKHSNEIHKLAVDELERFSNLQEMFG